MDNNLRSKKRKRNEKNWKQNKRKILKDAGKEYVSSRGQIVAEKNASSVKRKCNEKSCHKEGCEILTLEMKQKFFEDYRKLNYDDQSVFLTQCMVLINPARRRKNKEASTSRRKCTVVYKIGDFEVCQKTILDIFSISQRRLQTLQKKLKMGILAPKDQRGKHKKINKQLKADTIDLVKEQINSFPKELSHYSRKDSEQEYLNSNLSVSKMHRLFNEKYPENQVSRASYQRIFFTDFNLQFGSPRSDTCKECDLLFLRRISAQTEEEKNSVEIESNNHHEKAENGYKFLKQDTEKAKNNSGVITLSVDLQQVLFCPTLTHSNVFYQRQLSCYNFCIHDLGKNKATMNLWHEGIAKRGSAEIASCILKYIRDEFEVLKPGEERKLIVWSNRCVGQNNNWRLVTLYRCLTLWNYFSEVHQKFMTTGHSFLPCDRDFVLIEKKKKTSKVFVPSQWKYVIAEAGIKNPFDVVEMQQEDFNDIFQLQKSVQIKSVKITEAMWIKVTNDDQNAIYIRKGFDVSNEWERHSLYDVNMKRRSTKKSNEHNLQGLPENIPILYNGPLCISNEKKKDLLSMTDFLEPCYKEFYVNLPSS